MATMVLSTAGSALGGAVGGSFLGISSAAFGKAAGAIAGNYLDQKLFGQTATKVGPRLSNIHMQTSTEGAAIPRVFGRFKLAGQIIWTSKLKETVSTTTEGGKSSSSSQKTETTTYQYSANLAIGYAKGLLIQLVGYGQITNHYCSKM